MREPNEGPIAAASAPTAPQRATALARRAAGKACSTRASDEGSRSAAPQACSARAAISVAAEGATPQSAEATVKRPRPARKIRFRPIRSAMRPAGTRSDPNTIVYAFRTQESWAGETSENVARIEGNATYRTVLSSDTTNTATLVSRSVRQEEDVSAEGGSAPATAASSPFTGSRGRGSGDGRGAASAARASTARACPRGRRS